MLAENKVNFDWGKKVFFTDIINIYKNVRGVLTSVRYYIYCNSIYLYLLTNIFELKTNKTAENRAGVDRVNRVLFYPTIEKF